jgi:hypothetical protein
MSNHVRRRGDPRFKTFSAGASFPSAVSVFETDLERGRNYRPPTPSRLQGGNTLNGLRYARTSGKKTPEESREIMFTADHFQSIRLSNCTDDQIAGLRRLASDHPVGSHEFGDPSKWKLAKLGSTEPRQLRRGFCGLQVSTPRSPAKSRASSARIPPTEFHGEIVWRQTRVSHRDAPARGSLVPQSSENTHIKSSFSWKVKIVAPSRKAFYGTPT